MYIHPSEFEASRLILGIVRKVENSSNFQTTEIGYRYSTNNEVGPLRVKLGACKPGSVLIVIEYGTIYTVEFTIDDEEYFTMMNKIREALLQYEFSNDERKYRLIPLNGTRDHFRVLKAGPHRTRFFHESGEELKFPVEVPSICTPLVTIQDLYNN